MKFGELKPYISELFNIEQYFIQNYAIENDVCEISNGGIIETHLGRGQTISIDTPTRKVSIYFPYGIIFHNDKILFKYD